MKKAAIALAIAAATAAGALNISATASAETVYDYDYSRTGYSYVSVETVDFLERMLGTSLSAEEREYLDTYTDFALKYNDGIAGKYVKSEYREATGALSVTTSAFTYDAVNGSKVKWEPIAVNGNNLSSGVWNTTITDAYTKDLVTVSYSTSFDIAYTDINSFINLYYNNAKAASEKLAKAEADYQAAYADYLTKREAYLKYLQDYAQYEIDLAAYEKYVAEYSEWSIQDRRYQNYLAEYAEYEKELKAYEEYLKKKQEYDEALPRYQQYLTDKANYDKQYEEYLETLNDPRLEKQLEHITILDYIFTPVYINETNARTLYGAVMGDTVTQVLSRLGEVDDSVLSLAKLIRKPIDDAEAATKNLRDIFTKLNACKTDEDKYALYISNYDSLKTNLNMLLQTLDYFFRNSFVRSQIQGYQGVNRDLQFKIMIAQLYTVCHALDNNEIPSYYQAYRLFDKVNSGLASQFFYFDSNYTLKDENGKNPITPDALLRQYGGEPLPDTNDATPTDGFLPTPEKPIPPEVVPRPVQPTRVPQPVEPEEVTNPGPAPQAVKEPIEPEKKENPVEPVAYKPTEQETKLADHYNGGTLSYRNELTKDYTYNAFCEVEHYFRNAQLLTIEFYLSPDDLYPEYTAEDVQAGSSVEYGGIMPPVYEKRGYTVTFVGWQDSEGNPIDINAVPSTGSFLKLYPRYTETINMYDVIWLVEGVEYRAKVAYGAMPDYKDVFVDGDPVKPDDANGRQYRFTGWDREIAVMSDRTVMYTATFNDCTYFITFKINSTSYKQSVWKGEMPVYSGDEPYKPSDKVCYYTFSGWDKAIVEAQKDATYTAQFDEHYILDVDAEVELRDGMYVADCIYVNKTSLDLSVLTEWALRDGAGIILQMPAYIVTFSADEAYALRQSGAYTFTAQLTQTGITTSGYGMYEYRVDLTGAEDAVYAGTLTMSASSYIDTQHSSLYRIDGEDSIETRYTYYSYAVTFSMRAGFVYEIYPQYEITILFSEDVTITASTSVAMEKDIITLTVGEPPAGKFIDKLYVLDADGNEIEITEDYTFVMPEGDVSVGVTCGYYTYTVVFKSEGAVISTKTYRYGEEVVPPQQVFKAPDGEYSYTFIGWDKEIVPVTCDAEYNALFDAEPLPKPEPTTPPSETVQKVIWLANHWKMLLAIAVILFILFVTGIILIVRHCRKKRKLDKKQQ